MKLLSVIHQGIRRYGHEEFGEKSCSSRKNEFVHNFFMSAPYGMKI
jgi:hypothetical protein